MKKNMVYFVMYIVLITELLIVITERDDLQEAENQIRDKMLTTLAQIYKKPILLSVPELYSDYNLGNKTPKKVVMTPLGLYSDQEKKNVEFVITLAPKSPKPLGWPAGGVTSDTNKVNNHFKIIKQGGNAIFAAQFRKPGKYKFQAYCQVKRVLPDYLPDRLLKALKKQIGNTNLNQKSNTVDFTVNAKRIGGLRKKAAKWSL